MSEPQTIEAEVISIDGKAPPEPDTPRPEDAGPGDSGRGWKSHRAGRFVLNLDRRWWPLWIVLGVFVVALALLVGVFVAAGFLILASIRAVFRLLFGSGSASGEGSSIRPR